MIDRVETLFNFHCNRVTLGRALYRIGMTRKVVWKLNIKWNIAEEFRFWCEIRDLNILSVDQLMWFDEMHLDNRSFNRTYGQSMKGSSAKARHVFAKGIILLIIFVYVYFVLHHVRGCRSA